MDSNMSDRHRIANSTFIVLALVISIVAYLTANVSSLSTTTTTDDEVEVNITASQLGLGRGPKPDVAFVVTTPNNARLVEAGGHLEIQAAHVTVSDLVVTGTLSADVLSAQITDFNGAVQAAVESIKNELEGAIASVEVTRARVTDLDEIFVNTGLTGATTVENLTVAEDLTVTGKLNAAVVSTQITDFDTAATAALQTSLASVEVTRARVTDLDEIFVDTTLTGTTSVEDLTVTGKLNADVVSTQITDFDTAATAALQTSLASVEVTRARVTDLDEIFVDTTLTGATTVTNSLTVNEFATVGRDLAVGGKVGLKNVLSSFTTSLSAGGSTEDCVFTLPKTEPPVTGGANHHLTITSDGQMGYQPVYTPFMSVVAGSDVNEPAEGYIIFNTTEKRLQIYYESVWNTVVMSTDP
jgi:hypothetical protein